MPKIKSAKKNLRKSLKRRARNSAKKKVVRQAIGQYKKLLTNYDFEQAERELSRIYKLLDKAAKTNLFKRNKSSRLKSRLTGRLNQLKAKSTNTSS